MPAFKRTVVASLVLSLQIATAFGEDPPKLDVTATCDSAARYGLSGKQDKEVCLEDEHTAEGTIGQNWSKYSAKDKAMCVGTVKTGGPPSYVELLSCLEALRDAREYKYKGDVLEQSKQPVESTPRRGR